MRLLGQSIHWHLKEPMHGGLPEFMHLCVISLSLSASSGWNASSSHSQPLLTAESTYSCSGSALLGLGSAHTDFSLLQMGAQIACTSHFPVDQVPSEHRPGLHPWPWVLGLYVHYCHSDSSAN